MASEPAEGKEGTVSAGNALEDAILSALQPVMPPPLLGPSAGVFAAATKLGFGFANQVAGAYIDMLRGAVETNRVMADALGVTAGDRRALDEGASTVDDKSDLKRIPGVGPKLETMLKARGLASLEDIAALSGDEAAALDDELGLGGRITRDGWVKAAAALI